MHKWLVFFQDKIQPLPSWKHKVPWEFRAERTLPSRGHLDWTLHTQSHLARDWGEGHSKQKKSHEQRQCKDEVCTCRSGRTENDPERPAFSSHYLTSPVGSEFQTLSPSSSHAYLGNVLVPTNWTEGFPCWHLIEKKREAVTAICLWPTCSVSLLLFTDHLGLQAATGGHVEPPWRVQPGHIIIWFWAKPRLNLAKIVRIPWTPICFTLIHRMSILRRFISQAFL